MFLSFIYRARIFCLIQRETSILLYSETGIVSPVSLFVFISTFIESLYHSCIPRSQVPLRISQWDKCENEIPFRGATPVTLTGWSASGNGRARVRPEWNRRRTCERMNVYLKYDSHERLRAPDFETRARWSVHWTSSEQPTKNLRPLFAVRVYRSATTIVFVQYEKISGRIGTCGIQ